MIFGLVIFRFCPVSQLTCIQSNIAPSFQETTICKCSYWSVSNPSQKSIPNLPMYQDLAKVLFWGDHKSMFIKWYQIPHFVDQRLPPYRSWITNSTPGMPRRTNPPLVCYRERIHPWYAKDHESLVLWWNCWFWKKSASDEIIEKSLDHKKPGEWESQKKTFKNPRKIKFFLAATFSRISVIQTFFDEIGKNKKWKPRVFYGDRLYAEENDAMLRRTIPPLVCSGARIHPWYAKDHECQQSQNSPTHVGYGS